MDGHECVCARDEQAIHNFHINRLYFIQQHYYYSGCFNGNIVFWNLISVFALMPPPLTLQRALKQRSINAQSIYDSFIVCVCLCIHMAVLIAQNGCKMRIFVVALKPTIWICIANEGNQSIAKLSSQMVFSFRRKSKIIIYCQLWNFLSSRCPSSITNMTMAMCMLMLIQIYERTSICSTCEECQNVIMNERKRVILEHRNDKLKYLNLLFLYAIYY